MSLINCKVHLPLNWIESFIRSSAGNSATFKITNPKLYVPIVTSSTKDKRFLKLAKQLRDGFKSSLCWNEYKSKPEKVINRGTNIDILLDASVQGV